MPHGFELTIPTRWVLDATSASSTVLGAAAKATGLSQEEVLLVVLADAHPARGTHSPWAAYAEILPPVAPDAGSWLLDPEQGLLAGTDLGAALLTEEEELVALHTRVNAFAGHLFKQQPSSSDGRSSCSTGGGSSSSGGGGGMPLSLAHLRWARGMLLSRRFAALPRLRQSDAGTQGQLTLMTHPLRFPLTREEPDGEPQIP